MIKKVLLFSLIILQISTFHYDSVLADTPDNYLKGKFYSTVKDHFLIATKKMPDDRFKKTLIVMLSMIFSPSLTTLLDLLSLVSIKKFTLLFFQSLQE